MAKTWVCILLLMLLVSTPLLVLFYLYYRKSQELIALIELTDPSSLGSERRTVKAEPERERPTRIVREARKAPEPPADYQSYQDYEDYEDVQDFEMEDLDLNAQDSMLDLDTIPMFTPRSRLSP